MAQFDRPGKIENPNFAIAGNQGSTQLESLAVMSGAESNSATPDEIAKGTRKYPRASRQAAFDLDESSESKQPTTRQPNEEEPPADLPEVSRKVRRRRRRTRPRSKTIAMKRLTREELRIGALLYPPVDLKRPETRDECRVEQRPCPWVACKHHLYLDVNPETGSIKLNFPDLEPWELQETCALDVAERGGITLEEVGEIMNLTRERIRQVEVRGLRKIRSASPSPEELGALATDDKI